MKKIYFLTLLCLLMASVGFSQTWCTPTYVYASASCSSYGMWTRISVNGSSGSISDGSGCDGSGYQNRTSLSCTMYKGFTYTVTVFQGGSYSMNCQMWIDFNNDGTFASSEIVGGLNGYTGSAGSTFTITIPSGAASVSNGRMRIVTSYAPCCGGSYATMDPCAYGYSGGQYYYGEARDYGVTITNPPPSASASPASLAFGPVTTGTSSASQSTALTGSYLTPASSSVTVTAPSFFQVSANGTTWSSSYTQSYTSSTISAVPIYVRFQPTAVTSYSGNVTVTGGGLSSTLNIPVSGTGAATCSTTPTAGTASISPSTGSTATSFTLSVTGYSSSGGLSFQWQSSPTGTGTWSNITGATTINYTFSGLAASTDYRCVVTCTAYSLSANTNTVTATWALPTASCTPAPTYASAACTSYFMTFQSLNITGAASTSISDAVACNSTGYMDRTSLTCTLYKANTYNVSIGTGSSYQEYTQFWIDFNSDGIFQSTEAVGGNTTGFITTGVVPITIPSTVASGIYRMRGVMDYTGDGHSYSTMDPCMSGYNYGEARDYKVTITNPPPSDAATVTTMNFGNVATSTSSSAITSSISGLFLTPAISSFTVTAPSNYSVSTDGSTWYSSLVMGYTGSTLAATTLYVRFNAPASTGTYSGNVTITGGGVSTTLNIAVTGNSAVVCSGTPTAGTALVSPSAGTSATTFTCSLTGTTAATGLTYQWQSSTTSGGTYTNISGATNATYTFSGITSATYYRCVVTCSVGGGNSTSSYIGVPIYCVPAYSSASAACTSYSMIISSLTINGASSTTLSDVAGCNSTGYYDRTALSVTLQKGNTYNATVGTGSSYTMNTQFWIDYNNDGIFSSSESIGGLNGYSTSGVNVLTIPLTGVNPGTYRMRVVTSWNSSGYSYSSMDPCAAGYTYGEGRDYTVTLINPPPAVTTTPTSLAFGGVIVGATSGTQSFTMTGTYMLPTTGSVTVTAPGNFKVSSTGTSGWGSSFTSSYTSGAFTSVPVYVRFQPTSATSYSGNVTITGGGLASAVNVPVTGTGAANCSGTPTAGTAAVSPTSGNTSTSFGLSLSGTSAVASLTYQWQSSPTGTGSWSAISGATNPTYAFTGITATTYYSCIVTCTVSGLSSTSSNATATFVLPTASCTPAPTYAANACTSYFMTFQSLNLTGAAGTSISDALACNSSGYRDRTALSCTLYKGNSYTISIGTGSSYQEYTQFWIDFSGDGIFQTTEAVGGNTTGFTTSGTVSITIPSTVPSGIYRMRGVMDYTGDGHSYSSMDPCMAGYNYGEGRDYTVTIATPPPSVVLTPSNLSFGSYAVGATSSTQTFSMTGTFLTPATGSVTVTAPTNYKVYNGSSWTSSYTVSYTTGTLSATTVQVRFSPPSLGTFTNYVTITGGGLASAANDTVTGNGAASCTGTPTAGTAVATPSSGVVGTTYALSLTGTSVGLGLTYQWQSSTSGVSGTFTNISGATNATYSASGVTATTYYQCIVGCSYSGISGTSSIATVSVYCLPTNSNASASCSSYAMTVAQFILNGVSGTISDAAACGGTGYEDRTSLTCSIQAGQSYTATIGTGSSYYANCQVWIDYDNDGVFASSEAVAYKTNYLSTGNTMTLSTPNSATTGLHRMRIVESPNFSGYAYPTMDPCMTGYAYGDARDYMVTITPPAPTASATPTSLAFGGVLVSSCSTPQTFAVSGAYLTPASGSLTVAAPTGFKVSLDGSTWATSVNINYGGSTVTSYTVYVEFCPTTATSYSGNVAITGGGLGAAVNVAVTGTGAGACSSTPTAGTCVVSPTTGNSSTAFTLSLTGTTVASSLNYQWQSSPTGAGGSFTAISGATNPSYSFTGIGATTYYNCIVGCTPTSTSSTSSNGTATFVLPTASCTPAPTYASAACSSYGMTVNTLVIYGGASTTLNDAGVSCSGTGYENRTALSCTLFKANTYNVSIGTGSSYQEYTQLFIDFNSDGIFQSTETVGGNTTGFLTTGVVPITIPSTVPAGTYRMRIVMDYTGDGHVYPSMDPCMSGYNYGDGRDYTVVITNPPPSGTLTPTSMNFGNVAVSTSSTSMNDTLNALFLVPASGSLTVTAPTGYQVFGGSGWVTSYTIPYTGGTISGVVIPVEFNPTAIGTVTGNLTVTGGGLTTTLTDALTGNGAAACAGTPTAGTVVASPAAGTSATTFNLSLTGTSIGLGLTYQWFVSATGTSGWIPISGATNSTYSFSGLSTTQYYECQVGCSYSGLTGTSNVQSLAVYCTPAVTYGTAACSSYGMYINPFNLTGVSGSISDALACTGTAYEDRTALSTSLQAGVSYTATIGTGSSYNGNCQVWIDYNNDGTFASTETVGSRSGYIGGGNTFAISTPTTAPLGSHRMRIVFDYTGDGHASPTMDPCMSGYNYGDARDYTITITPPPPTVVASPPSLAFGGVLVGASSSALTTAITGSYLSPATGSFTVTAPTNFQVSTDGSTWVSSYSSITYAGSALSATTIYVRFNPTAAITYTGNVTVTGGGLSTALNIPVTGTGAGACSGTPTAGTVVSSPTHGNGSTSFTLNLSGTTVASGFTYQWQSSPTGSSYTAISGATNASYSFTGLSATTYYNCVVTCPTYASATATNCIDTFVLPTASCTPAPTYGNYACTSYGMTFYTLNLTGASGSISDALACNSTGYRDRTALGCSLSKGSTYTISITTGSSYNEYCQFWIDFNGDGIFQTTESVGGNASAFITSGTVSISIPITAPLGVYRMRGVMDYSGDGHSYPSMDPCMSGYNYGEGRDYTITIVNPPPTVVATPTSVPFGPVLTSTTSGAQYFVMNGSYMLPTTGSVTVTAPSNFSVCATSGGSYTTAITYSYSGGSFSNDTVWVKFSPSAATSYSGNVAITGGGLGAAVNVAVTGTGAGACSGTPTAGTAVVSPTTGNMGTSFALSLTGTTVASGFTYQWRSSPDGTTWTNISGATNVGYSFTGIGATTYYNCIVTCPTYASATSGNATATFVLPTASCTPAPTYANYACTSYGMTFYTLNLTGASGSISDALACNSTGYQDRTSLTTTLYKGYTYNISITTGSSYNEFTQFWIDFNSDGIFQTTESVGGNASAFLTSGTVSISIPSTVSSGVYRMRGVMDYSGDGHSYPTMDPCMGGYNYGEGRDYKITISNPPPSVVAAPTTVPFGPVLTGTTSGAQYFVMNGTYMLPTSGSVTVTAPTNFSVCATSGGTYTTAITYSYTAGTFTNDTVWVKFSPSAATSYSGNVAITGGGLGATVNVAVTGNGAGACSGTPTAGTAVATPSTGSGLTSISLSLTGTTVASGFTYQWQSSPTTSGFTAISGATNPSYTFSGLGANTYYNCVVTCPTYASATSSYVLVTYVLPTASCTPAPTYASAACTSYNMTFYTLTLAGGSGTISDALACNSTGYRDRTSLSCTLYKGNTYTISITTGSSYNEYTQFWIDFNGDGTFQTSEKVGGNTTSFITSGTVSITVPGTVASGTYRMRGVMDYTGDGHVYPTMDPCMSGYNYGEGRDYTVIISNPPPAVVATPASIAFGGVLTGSTAPYQTFSITGSYMVPSTGSVTITAPSSVYQVSTDTVTWGSTATVSYTGATIPATNVYVRFTPAAAITYSGNVTITGGGLGSAVNVAVSGTGAGACSGTVTAGTANSSPTTGASGTTFVLSLSGTTVASGMTYQWQSSATGAGGSFSSIGGATNATYSFSGLLSTTYYNCIVTCPASSSTSTSSNVTVTFVLPSASCTPAPSSASASCSSYFMTIQSLLLNGASSTSINDALACTGAGYENRTALSCTLLSGNSYVATIGTGSSYSVNTQAWIDFNGDGVFQTSEKIGGANNITGSSNAVTYTLPTTGLSTGTFRMRVITSYNGSGYTYPTMDPCMSGYTYGDARDYTVTVIAPTACSGTPAAGSTTATLTSGCAPLSTTLSFTGSPGVYGLNYQWKSSTTGTVGSYSSISGATSATYATSVSSSTYYICSLTCAYSGGGSAASGALNINPSPSPTAIGGSSTVCQGGTTTLTDGLSGGTWTSSNTAVATITSGGVVTGVAAGSCTISYTTTGCSPVTLSFTVNTSPSATISGFTSICVGGSASLTNTTSGGTWSSSNTAIVSLGASTGIATATGAGTATVTYSNGCGTPATTSFTSNPTPSIITGPSSVCISNTGTFSDSLSGGTWSNSPSTYGTINASTGVFTASSTVGTSILTYTVGYCSASASVDVGNTSPGSITGGGSLCYGGTTTMTDATAGGAWSSSNTSVATVDFTTGVVTGVSSGTATITYSTGCGTAATSSITINGSPVTISGSTVCSQSTLNLTATTGTGTYTYSWTGPNSFTSTVQSPSISAAPTARTGIYSVTATQSGCSSSSSFWASVDTTVQVAELASPSTICPGGSSSLRDSVTSPLGGSTNYNVIAIPYAPLTLSTVTAGPTGTNVSTAVTMPFSFNFYGTSYSTINICTNGFVNFGTSSTLATTHSLPSSASAPLGMIALFWHALLPGTGSITYTTLGSAPNRKFVINYNNVAEQTGSGRNSGQLVLYESSNIIDMFVSKANSASFYSGVCGIQNAAGTSAVTIAGENNVNYTINNTVAGTGWRFAIPTYTYNWAPSTGLSSTSIYNPVASSVSATTVYTVTTVDGTSMCTTGNVATNTVTVNPLPTVYTMTPHTGCSSGTSVSLSNSQSGMTYQLYRGGTAVGSAVSGTGSAISLGTQTVAGVYRIIGSNSTGCTSTMSDSTTIYTSPTAYAVSGGSGCSLAGVAVGLPNSQSGVNYQLWLNGTTTVGSAVSGTGSALSFGTQNVAGTYTVIATGTTGGCTTSMTSSAVVNQSPAIHNVTGGVGCSGVGVTIGVDTTQSGVSYQLYLGVTAVGSPVSGTGSSISFGLQTTSGTYTVVATGTASCQANMAGSVTIYSGPTTYTLTGGNGCSLSGVTVALSGSQTGVTYQLWRNGTTALGTGLAGTGSAISFGTQTVAGSYTVIATNSTTGCTTTMTGSSTVNPSPAIHIVTGGNGCTATGVTIGVDTTQSGVSYQLYRGAATVGSPISGTGGAITFGLQTIAGSYTVVATGTASCQANMSGTVVISTSPSTYTVTGGNACSSAGVTVGLSGSASGVSYQLFVGSTGLGTTSGTGSSISFGLQTTAGVYTIVGTGTGSCSTTMTGSDTVRLSPTIYNMTGGGNYCGAAGLHVGTDGSQTGYSYQLYRDGTAVGTAVSGTGSALDFGAFTTVGTYTVYVSASGFCTSSLAGSAVISDHTVGIVLGADPTLCTDATSVYHSYSGATGSPTYYSISWSGGASTAGFAPVSGAGLPAGSISIAIPTGITAGTYTGTLTVSNGICTSPGYPITISIVAYPNAGITSAVPPCAGYTSSIVISGTAGASIVYSVDGGTATTATLTGGTYSIGTGVIVGTHTYELINAHNGTCTSVYDSTISIAPTPMQWVGGATGFASDWNTSANWSCGFVPGASDDVTIPSGVTTYPVIVSGTFSTRALTIAAGANVTLNTGTTLKVLGDLTNNGSVNGAGTLNMNSSALAQNMGGIGFVNNLSINNSMGVTILPGARTTVNGVLSLDGGVLTTNDSLVLNSLDTGNSARVAPIIVGGAGISGMVREMKFIAGGRRAYRFVGHPFSNSLPLSQLQNYIDVTGAGGTINGFTFTATNAPSAFRYDPYNANSSIGADPGWRAYTSCYGTPDSNLVHRYQGIRLYIRGAKGEGLGYADYIPSDVTMGMWGNLNQGTQTIHLGKGALMNQDYNMVANPYPSPTNVMNGVYHAWNSGNIAGSAIYVWDARMGTGYGNFVAVPINSLTPYSMDAFTSFQIRAMHNNDSIVMYESDKTAVPTTYALLKSSPDHVALTIYDNNYHPWDVLNIHFNDGAKDEEDVRFDARKLFSPDFNFYSISRDGQQLTIDQRPYDSRKVIPLGISSNYKQEFIIKAADVALPEGATMYLHDKLLQQYVLLQQGTEYRFTVGDDEATQGDKRFELTTVPTSTVGALNVTMVPNPTSDDVKITFTATGKDNVSVRVLDLSGVAIYSSDLGAQQIGNVSINMSNFAAGVYMVEFTSGDQKVVQRLVKE